jgi:ACS family D-galactonate transporter-like MFS transporter
MEADEAAIGQDGMARGGAQIGPVAKATRRRLVVAALLLFVCLVNYLDRANLAVAGPLIAREFHLRSVELGLAFSAFGWGYVLLQPLSGYLADRVHPRRLYAPIIAAWSASTITTSFIAGLNGLVLCRLALGLTEAPSYIINNRVTTTWFPENERSTVIALYTSAQYIGLAFSAPVLSYVASMFGWRAILLVTGLLGGVVCLSWSRYREPTETPGVNASELDLIRAGGGVPDFAAVVSAHRSGAGAKSLAGDLRVLFGRTKLWGIYIGQFASGTTQSFFLTWFPTYLVEQRHLPLVRAGMFTAAPYLAGLAGLFTSGWLSNRLSKRGWSSGLARKAPIIAGLCLSTVIVGANYLHDDRAMLVVFSLAFFGSGLAGLTWALVSSIAPLRLLGATGGAFNVFGWISSISTPLVVGVLAGVSFNLALAYIGLVAAVGAVSYVFLVGDITRIEA